MDLCRLREVCEPQRLVLSVSLCFGFFSFKYLFNSYSVSNTVTFKCITIFIVFIIFYFIWYYFWYYTLFKRSNAHKTISSKHQSMRASLNLRKRIVGHGQNYVEDQYITSKYVHKPALTLSYMHASTVAV